MVKVVFEGFPYQLSETETLLDGLLEQGVAVSHSCKTGVCQSCLLRCTAGQPPPMAQKGLKESLVFSRHFLACQCAPQDGMEIVRPNAEGSLIKATVTDLKPLNQDVLQVFLKPESDFSYRAGQFVRVYNPEGVGRCYSLASVPLLDEDLILHVKKYPNGLLSGWLHDTVKPLDTVTISREALGECCYLPGQAARPILMIGTGTGLAPLYGIVRDALQQGHQGHIHLFLGVRNPDGLYLEKELRALEVSYSNFHFRLCVSDASTSVSGQVPVGRASDLALAEFPVLKGWRVYLCGNPLMVRNTQMQAFIAGAALDEIHADPFDFE